MKFTLLTVVLSAVSMSCANTSTLLETGNASETNNKSVIANAAQINSAAPHSDSVDSNLNADSVSDNDQNSKEIEITLEQIMSDPDWFGRQAESWYWGDNSDTLFYKQKREGNNLRDLFVQPISGANKGAEKVNLAELHKVLDQNAVLNDAKTQEVYTFEGNVFVKTLATGNVHQLTYTSAVESDAMFLTNGDVAYRVDNVFYRFDSKNKQIKELANIVMNEDSSQTTKEDGYLAKEQNKLIQYVALQAKNAQLEKDQKRDFRVNNKSITQTNFYFSKDLKVVHASLSPSGTKILVSVTDKDDSIYGKVESSDVMPNYISDSGNISIIPARSRVSANSQYHEYMYVLDITNGTKEYLAFDALPGFNEDVLASVRKENYKAQGHTYKSEKSARYIHVMEANNPIQWNKNGDNVAVLFEAWDNKDRWLATIDFDAKKLVSQHRLHDNAWINWSFNEFGWLNKASADTAQSNDALYYLSEESGYSHVYVKPLNGKAKQFTSGKFEVNDVTLASDEQSLFFRANIKHPGIYEIYELALDSADITQLTDLGGDNYYQLSPNNTKLLISHSTINMPPELYVETVDATPEATRLTYTVSEQFLAMPWSMPSVVAIESSHQAAPVYSKVYLPEGYDSSTSKNKAVMFTHGAGYLQNSHLGWSGYFREYMFHSMLVQKGYVVIDMDYRASAGYGRDWRTAIYRHMGKPEVEDMRDGVNWLVDNANVDRNRVGTYGGSYGGFLTLMSMFTQPDLFQSGSALRLVSDWAYYNHGYTSNILNTPFDDPIAYERSSPIYFAEGLQKPLLINAPMIDDNVFFQDTVRLVQRLIELEKQDFETAIYPVEPHGFIQPSSWLNEYRRIFKLFETTL
ncbi:prolyl oligopeptidase family serine peptidase [Pseudocolwellia sp. HL-MZ19]|uniref:S9 family peptidase n=1 Tax=Pseudocolwellia sp. HL-MZ19 TaxID=3400846 RepID=UPI003CE8912F